MANKSLREFSAPTTANIRTGPAAEIEQNFELKPALINMVQASQFCGKAHEDASAHLQYFLEICSTFTIKDVPRDAILLRLFPFSLLGRAKQWFYANKEKNTMWALCSTNFLAKFFPMGKTNALRGKISSFQQQHDESVPEAWERFQDYKCSSCSEVAGPPVHSPIPSLLALMIESLTTLGVVDVVIVVEVDVGESLELEWLTKV
jgi:hypothetical protein